MRHDAFGRKVLPRRHESAAAAEGREDVRVVADWETRLPAPVPLRLSTDRDDPWAASAAAEVGRRLLGGHDALRTAAACSRLLPVDAAGVVATPAIAPNGVRLLVVSGVVPVAAAGDDVRALRIAQGVAREVNARVLGYRCAVVAGHLVATNHVVVDAQPSDAQLELTVRVLRDVFAEAAELRREGTGSAAAASGFALVDEVLRLETAYRDVAYDVFDARTAVDAWRLSLDDLVAAHVRLELRRNGVRVLLPLPQSSQPGVFDVVTVTLPNGRGSGLAIAVDLPSWLPSWLTERLASTLDDDPTTSDMLQQTTPWGLGTWAIRSPDRVGAPLSFRGFVPDTVKPYAELVDVVSGVAVSAWQAWARLQGVLTRTTPAVTSGGGPPR